MATNMYLCHSAHPSGFTVTQLHTNQHQQCFSLKLIAEDGVENAMLERAF